MKVYLAHSISTFGEFEDSKRVADEIRALGYKVYAAAENAGINDKSNNPSPIDIYNEDVYELISSDICVVNLSGQLQDGTISEIGFVSGYNEGKGSGKEYIKIIGYTSNARLQIPQFHKGIPSASANHLVLGMVEKWGIFVGTETNMLKTLKNIRDSKIS